MLQFNIIRYINIKISLTVSLIFEQNNFAEEIGLPVSKLFVYQLFLVVNKLLVFGQFLPHHTLNIILTFVLNG